MNLPTLSALVLGFLQQPSPLPEAPPGWQTERIPFPLSFAPQLAYHGFEDLAFAPGMFDPSSDSYFSYVLALRLEGDVYVDEAMLLHFLESYYRGLCLAVSQSKGSERTADDVAVQIERRDGAYQATIAMFDPFTTGADLSLKLQLHVHDAPGATEILGLASPQPSTAPIWKELQALSETWLAARPAPLYLNHLFAVVQPQTYRALASSSFLREQFAINEERTTVRADLTYSGLYFYGEHTYFEFLPPGAALGTGLALGVERSGALAALQAGLSAAQVATQWMPITRKLGDKSVPWFDLLGIEMPPSQLSLFAMEYSPEFLKQWHPDQLPSAPGIARAEILERYASSLGHIPQNEKPLFRDIQTIDFALTPAERERLLVLARQAGWTITGDSTPIRVRSPHCELRIHDWTKAAPAPGITNFSVRLREALARDPLELGQVHITFEGTSAIFRIAH